MLCAGNFFLIAFSLRVTCYVLANRYSASSRTETDLTFPDGSLFFFYFQGDLRRPAALQAVHIRFLRHHSHNALCGTPFGIDIPTIGQANQSFKLHS